jgi:hypothetical protein
MKVIYNVWASRFTRRQNVLIICVIVIVVSHRSAPLYGVITQMTFNLNVRCPEKPKLTDTPSDMCDNAVLEGEGGSYNVNSISVPT